MTDDSSSIWRWIADLLMMVAVVPVIALIVYCLILAYRIFHPPRKHNRREPKTGLALQELRLASTDGVALSAFLVRPAVPRATVVICHEWGAHKATKLKYAEMVVEYGCAVLLFDLRNHGDSDSDSAWGDMSRRYTDDLAAAVRTVRADPELGCSPVIVLAFSFSTFPAVHGLAHRPDAAGDALILDSGPVFDEHDITDRFMTQFGATLFPGWLHGPIFFPLAKRLSVALVGHLLCVEWPAAADRLGRPMLLFCGSVDRIAVEPQIRAFADRLSDVTVHTMPECPHLLAFKLAPEQYRQAVLDFIDRICEESVGNKNGLPSI